MLFSAVFERFVDKTPAAVLLRGVLERALAPDDLDRLFDTVKREKGKIDVLYASAGTGEAVPLGEITEQHFDATFGLNTRGTLFTVQKVRIPTKSPGCTDMKSPGDSETMSPTSPI